MYYFFFGVKKRQEWINIKVTHTSGIHRWPSKYLGTNYWNARILKTWTNEKNMCCFEKIVIHYINEIKMNCQRTVGMGNCTIKNHLYFHLPQYIKMWGPPAWWDSAASESNHKTEIKAPAKNTQRNANCFIEQTVSRQLGGEKIQHPYRALDNNHIVKSLVTKTNPIAGSKFTIFLKLTNNVFLWWIGRWKVQLV